MALDLAPDVLVIGSGIGGASATYGLAPSGARILVLERGRRVANTSQTRDDRAIYQQGYFRSAETWRDARGREFSPGNYYNVGGNSKFYGAVLYRYRAEDFSPRSHCEGDSPGWPITYAEIEPWYGKAENLFQVRGSLGEDPTEPFHSTPYAHAAVPDEPSIAEVRQRLKRVGLLPSSLPLAIDIEKWLTRGKTPWDGFPDTFTGKIDAETGPLERALAHPNVSLMENAEALTIKAGADGRRIEAVLARVDGKAVRFTPGTTILAAGAVQSAAILLRSRAGGVANSSGQVGRNFMNHNCTAMITIDPLLRNRSIYQKTLGLNDFYLKDPRTGMPLGNVQLLGKISAPILKANLTWMPEALLRPVTAHSIDWYLMSEDLPNPASRVLVDGRGIKLDWRRSNLAAHQMLVARMRERFRAAGFPIVLSKAFDKRTPSHQCGTAAMGTDPASSVVDTFGRSHDHENLLICDAACCRLRPPSTRLSRLPPSHCAPLIASARVN
jgi:choline dehydrogenase-like flavoprotein